MHYRIKNSSILKNENVVKGTLMRVHLYPRGAEGTKTNMSEERFELNTSPLSTTRGIQPLPVRGRHF